MKKHTFTFNSHNPTTATPDDLSAIAAEHAARICDHIETSAPHLSNRLLYSVIFSYIYNMFLISHPNIHSTQRATHLAESLGTILATAGINIDALISYTPGK